MYRYHRYKNTYTATDADANAGGGGFGLPPGGGVGTGPEGPFYLFRLYKYSLDVVTESVSTAANIIIAPCLCWVNNAGTFIDAIETDYAVNNYTGGFSLINSFAHDYGTEGLLVYRPAIDNIAYFIGLIDRSGLNPSQGSANIILDYGIDIDYRKLTKPVPTV